MPLTIASYNVNGIRAAVRKGLLEWLEEHDLDIVCIQETKAQPDQVDTEAIEKLGYNLYWHSAAKKGYSGVLTLSKQPAAKVVAGCNIPHYDDEGRILRTDFGDWTLLNCYFPSGTSGDLRQAFKYKFLDEFFIWIENLRRERPKLIVVGDYNIAHTEIDIHNPVSNKKSSGFLPAERAWMSKWFESGFTDSFRSLHPERVEYSWWSYRAAARQKNKGWRIDYQSVSDNIAGKLVAARHMNEAHQSDHCPVFVSIDID